jgi:hypothetical protein
MEAAPAALTAPPQVPQWMSNDSGPSGVTRIASAYPTPLGTGGKAENEHPQTHMGHR